MTSSTEILNDVRSYYDEKLTTFGQTSRGVDWKNVESQELRFLQLFRLFDLKNSFSVNDLGCGFGSLYGYLTERKLSFNYHGVDISEQMIQAAKEQYVKEKNCFFDVSSVCQNSADFSVTSGIFNVKLTHNDTTWLQYILSNINHLNDVSKRGFAFNCLTKYSDKEFCKDSLYYADPGFLFDYCKTKFSRNVALLHDYDLYEFTIIVHKNAV